MYKFLQERYSKIAYELAGTKSYFSLTPPGVCLFRSLRPLIEEYSSGKLIDAGAGRGAWEPFLSMNCSEYISVDIKNSLGRRVNIIADIQNLEGITDESTDTIFCSQVLEHLPEPQRAINEFYRVLKPHGIAILSVPHMSHLHNEPDDYYRYTKHGLKYMLGNSGFEILHIDSSGGLFSFIGQIPVNILLSLFYFIPVIGKVAAFTCRLWSHVAVWLDSHLEKKKIFALNYVAIARK